MNRWVCNCKIDWFYLIKNHDHNNKDWIISFFVCYCWFEDLWLRIPAITIFWLISVAIESILYQIIYFRGNKCKIFPQQSLYHNFSRDFGLFRQDKRFGLTPFIPREVTVIPWCINRGLTILTFKFAMTIALDPFICTILFGLPKSF